MSKDEIEKNIRSIFYLLFGVIFTFIFILTSSYLENTTEINNTYKKQTELFIIDYLKSHERFFFEDFKSKSFSSIQLRLINLLNAKEINLFKSVIIENNHCLEGDRRLCSHVKDIAHKFQRTEIQSLESLGKFIIIIPINDWENNNNNFIGLEIPLSQIVSQQSFIKKLLFYVIPFLILIALTMIIYHFTEKNLIKPTIRRVIESEKIQVQKSMIRQVVHDIRSPIGVLENIIESNSFIDEEAELIASEAIDRIKVISEDLLLKEKYLENLANIPEIIQSIVAAKKIEFKSQNPRFDLEFDCVTDFFTINAREFIGAISNIINNAIEAVESTSPQIKIMVRIDSKGLTLKISDNGKGIRADEIPLIKVGNYTTKNKGNGLGILGIRKWLKKIQGEFTIESSIGSGTSILMFIPG